MTVQGYILEAGFGGRWDGRTSHQDRHSLAVSVGQRESPASRPRKRSEIFSIERFPGQHRVHTSGHLLSFEQRVYDISECRSDIIEAAGPVAARQSLT